MAPFFAYVFGGDGRRPWLAARSVRSLTAAGIENVRLLDAGEMPGKAPALLLRAGYWLARPDHFMALPESARPPIAIGLPPFGAGDDPWLDLQARHGGHLMAVAALPPPDCEWHPTLESAQARLRGEALPDGTRLVHFSALDFSRDTQPRVLEIVTSLQHGGAEKVAADLARHLPAFGVSTLLAVLGKPLRQTLRDAPPAVDLSHVSRASRAEAVKQLAAHHGIDALHLHLTGTEDTRALGHIGLPSIVTVHNTTEGWPAGWTDLEPRDVTLFLACANSVARDLKRHLPGIPVRTVWNGIEPFKTRPVPGGEGFTIACVANPRPQKRLHLLPGILAATREELQRRGRPHELRLIVAGEVSDRHPTAPACRQELEAAARQHGIPLEFTNGSKEVPDVLAEAHVLVSCSGHEGLSLAHLEALSAGLPVVATAVGGTAEIASRCPALRLVPADANPVQFAAVLAEALLDPPPSNRDQVRTDFSVARMADRSARLIRQSLDRPASPGETFWFVTNNLSTGGAQSSLRRLAVELHQRGLRVRVALLQEYPDRPTPGRRALIEAGIEVFTPPPVGMIDHLASADLILAELAADPPRSLVFWNALPASKFLLADRLLFTRVIDVSPGEMFFASMQRWLDLKTPGLPVCEPADYGRLLDAVVVKYRAEAGRAAELGAPVHVIPNGVPLPLLPPRQSSGVLVFGTAARLSPNKRIEDLLAAYRLALPGLPPSVLRIAGEAETGSEDYAAGLLGLCEGLPVEWVGEPADLAAFHAGLDVFVMISNPAGCPNASLEALAAGLPVIATDIGGASEQVIDGITGKLMPPYDADAFAKAMIELAQSPDQRRLLGQNARHHIQDAFSLDRMTDAWHSLMTAD